MAQILKCPKSFTYNSLLILLKIFFLDRWSWVGQNLYMVMWGGQAGDGSDVAPGIESWFSEHKNFVYPNTSNGVTGHYTQVNLPKNAVKCL